MKVTIHDVAKKAGVSASTVSKYINGGNLRVSEKERVVKAIADLNFVPNSIARSLKTKKSYSIGVIVPTMASMFSAGIISSMERYLEKEGYSVIFCDCNGERKQEIDRLNFLIKKDVDAFVLLSSTIISNDLKDISKPIILLDKPIDDFEADLICIDNFNAGYFGTNLLINNGHKDIAILIGDEGVYTSDERLKGYIKALEENRITINKDRIIHTDFTYEDSYNKICTLIESKNLPSAIFAVNDDCTSGAVTALNKYNISIPNDISFLGFDNLLISKISNPALTIIYQNNFEMGKRLAERVLLRINEYDKKTEISNYKKVVVDYSIIQGNSIKTII